MLFTVGMYTTCTNACEAGKLLVEVESERGEATMKVKLWSFEFGVGEIEVGSGRGGLRDAVLSGAMRMRLCSLDCGD